MQTDVLASSWSCLSFVGKMQHDKCESDITQLYRFYSQNGTLLYVGISISAVSRYGHHKLNGDWWLQVSKMEIVNYPTRAMAEEAETAAIVKERPLFNKNHSTFKSEEERTMAVSAAIRIGRGLRIPAETQKLEYEIVEVLAARNLEKQMLIDEITEYGALGDCPDGWLRYAASKGLEVDSWEVLDKSNAYDLQQLLFALEDAAEKWLEQTKEEDWR